MLGTADSFSVFDSLLNKVLSVEGCESNDDEERGDGLCEAVEAGHGFPLGNDAEKLEVLRSGGVELLSLAIGDLFDDLDNSLGFIGVVNVSEDKNTLYSEGGDEGFDVEVGCGQLSRQLGE